MVFNWLQALFSLLPVFADPAVLRPFGGLPFTGFLNVPQSPNYYVDPLFGVGEALLHLPAVDLLQDAGTPVYSVIDGTARYSRSGNFLHDWTTTIQVTGAAGFFTYYMHLDPDSVPRALRDGLSRPEGVKVQAGTMIGRLHPAPDGMKAHLHFGVAHCKTRRRLNPMAFLDYRDTRAPEIHEILAKKDGAPTGDDLSGAISLSAVIDDRIDSVPGLFPPNRVEFSIARADSPSKPIYESVLFDATDFPFRGEGTDLGCEKFNEIDGYDAQLGAALYRAPTENADGTQRFAYALTSGTASLSKPMASWLRPHLGLWNTAECDAAGARKYPDGRYLVRVQASDIRGNSSDATHEFRISNPGCTGGAL